MHKSREAIDEQQKELNYEKVKELNRELKDLNSSIIYLWDYYLKKVNELDELLKQK